MEERVVDVQAQALQTPKPRTKPSAAAREYQEVEDEEGRRARVTGREGEGKYTHLISRKMSSPLWRCRCRCRCSDDVRDVVGTRNIEKSHVTGCCDCFRPTLSISWCCNHVCFHLC